MTPLRSTPLSFLPHAAKVGVWTKSNYSKVMHEESILDSALTNPFTGVCVSFPYK